VDAKGRGIIWMHDINRRPAMALPILLKDLKANGYKVVHVVAGGERPTSIPELMASPAPDEKASPTVLAKAPSGDDALTARQNHRAKKRKVSRHHQVHSWSEMTTERAFWVFGAH